MRQSEIQDIEVKLFVEAMRLRHGYDFRNYAMASLKRRIVSLCAQLGATHVLDLIPRLLNEPSVHRQMISQMSVPVSEMFRDPAEFKFLRESVIPLLQSYPRVTIWQAGCANGEEVYSVAIMLLEEGIYHRCTIFATDINDIALEWAEEGIYSLSALRAYDVNYRRAGGKFTLDRYYRANHNSGIIDSELRKNIIFTHHNLVSDGVFCEANFVMCRNVLIYFDRILQGKVLQLFRECLARGGFLCLGTKESISIAEIAEDFRVIDPERSIFQFQPKPRPCHEH